ncbi:helix-turn-helix domain-containing protein [Paenibacillus sp. Leaf72]|uniref:helix-turn-helix domain-containing protein n=1 Tax=Paenibacillus sp. Leaf72 TaxID=1736234 RepID=UPI0007021AC1|nr:AraC family transcriptional regulator [Paenibacillus sp. Leaf72]KQO14735.1 hypothetical protein ASF12_29145 [Paenibacillus sp. Leaf72]
MNRLLYLANDIHERNTNIPPHQHECYELVYYIRGMGPTVIAGRKYRFKEHTIALIAPRHIHSEIHELEGEVLFIGFNAPDVELKGLSGVYDDDASHTILKHLWRIKEEFFIRPRTDSESLNALLNELLPPLQQIFGNRKTPHPSEDRVKYVLQYMDDHYKQKLTVELLADMSGYSYDRFRHLFKERYNIAPLQYILLKRLEYAKSLLTGTQMHISEIAADAGFANDAQFCSMFKREIGCTPRTYRKGKIL